MTSRKSIPINEPLTAEVVLNHLRMRQQFRIPSSALNREPISLVPNEFESTLEQRIIDDGFGDVYKREYSNIRLRAGVCCFQQHHSGRVLQLTRKLSWKFQQSGNIAAKGLLSYRNTDVRDKGNSYAVSQPPPHATFSPTPTLANHNAKPHCQAEVEVQSISKRLKLLPLYELKRSRKTLLSYETWQECELFGNTYCRDMGRGLRRLLTYLLTLTSTVNMDTEHLICVVECYRTQPMITNTLRTTCRRKTQFERGYGSTQTVQTAICCYDVQVIPYTFSSTD
ncbi:hypothetical protein ANN_00498 [Periplaneta americana]|uniref:Uncharacterized protein n=1 Tax=Periplaneta americana TaxID=6978 RepID=A0ABQ8TTD3_PERAM|nr:hypothetical protein ANN_00498 [Periplaneta americana]